MFRRMVANAMRPAFRPEFATRGMATQATKLIVSITGPANQMALSNFTRTIQGQGANLGGSRSMEVSGTVSISSVVFLKSGDDQVERTAALTWALQTNMQGYIVSARPALPVSACPAFARVTVTGAERMGILAELADHLDSRSVQVSTMRTFTDASRYGADGIEGTDDDEDPLYTCVALRHRSIQPARGLAPQKRSRCFLSPSIRLTPPRSCAAQHARILRRQERLALDRKGAL